MSNFTKGPWDIGGNENGGLKSRVYCDDKTGSAVAGCEFSLVWRDREEVDANVRLIAAAPDMYEALTTLISIVGLTAFRHESQRKVLQEAVDSGYKALAKARGESPEIPLFEGTREALNKLTGVK